MHMVLVHMYNPLLAVFGIPIRVAPFPLYEYQAAYLAQLYQGTIELPPVDKMEEEYRSDQQYTDPFEGRGSQVPYTNRLIDLINGTGQQLDHVSEHWAARRMHSFQLRRESYGY
ncbi:hypothetical protein GGF46_002801 [Coemansia sp. RSA 552]|nr:hypothetical protein GGF46_002801 [Coemansia sp. RSA 552]